MTIRTVEAVWLNTSDICSIEHIVEVSGLARNDILDLVEAGVLKPSNDDPRNYFFHMESIVVARTARRLRDDFELDPQGLAVAMSLLGRIKQLEKELSNLHSRFHPFIRRP